MKKLKASNENKEISKKTIISYLNATGVYFPDEISNSELERIGIEKGIYLNGCWDIDIIGKVVPIPSYTFDLKYPEVITKLHSLLFKSGDSKKE